MVRSVQKAFVIVLACVGIEGSNPADLRLNLLSPEGRAASLETLRGTNARLSLLQMTYRKLHKEVVKNALSLEILGLDPYAEHQERTIFAKYDALNQHYHTENDQNSDSGIAKILTALHQEITEAYQAIIAYLRKPPSAIARGFSKVGYARIKPYDIFGEIIAQLEDIVQLDRDAAKGRRSIPTGHTHKATTPLPQPHGARTSIHARTTDLDSARYSVDSHTGEVKMKQTSKKRVVPDAQFSSATYQPGTVDEGYDEDNGSEDSSNDYEVPPPTPPRSHRAFTAASTTKKAHRAVVLDPAADLSRLHTKVRGKQDPRRVPGGIDQSPVYRPSAPPATCPFTPVYVPVPPPDDHFPPIRMLGERLPAEQEAAWKKIGAACNFFSEESRNSVETKFYGLFKDFRATLKECESAKETTQKRALQKQLNAFIPAMEELTRNMYDATARKHAVVLLDYAKEKLGGIS